MAGPASLLASLPLHHVAARLLERSGHLSFLRDSLSTVIAERRGRLVFVRGEAGVGKSALIRLFGGQQRGSARILSGSCDALFTPRPLGPILDVAELTGGELELVAARGALPHEVAAALVRELQSTLPTILVLEDLHWADEATLDVVRLLARRVEGASCLVLASYRDDEIVGNHPLRFLLGEVATNPAVDRLTIEPLSPEAVAEMAEPRGVDSDDLYAKTAGNSFFVTEVLAAGGEEIPSTVKDAVFARIGRLRTGARALLEAVAVLPHQAELWLLEALAEGTIDHLEECLSSGVLAQWQLGVRFRHELARLAVEDSLAPDRRLALHRKALSALADPPGAASPDVARLAHHAEAAGDADSVLRFAPAAAVRAGSLGAHREAAAQYARALRFAGAAARETVADLLERRAHECYLADQSIAAIDSLQEAIQCRRELGNKLKEGDGCRLLAQILWSAGMTAEAEVAAREAVAILEQLPPGRELAMAYSVLASRHMNADEAAEALEWGSRGLQLAEEFHDDDIVAHALNTIGTTELLNGEQEGREKLHRSVELAQGVGSAEQVARAFTNEAWAAVRTRSYAALNRGIHSWLQYCEEKGLELWRLHLLAYLAEAELGQGRWTAAADAAALVIRVPHASPLPRTIALVVLGLTRARRGDPGVWSCLDEAQGLAEPTGELQRVAPVAAARAEALWLEGDLEAVAGATDAALALAASHGAPWTLGELVAWRWRSGIQENGPAGLAEPYELQMAGSWAQAAKRWREIGCPYESAMALADADDDGALRRALDELLQLGAQPAASLVTKRLRDRGSRRLPRGPRSATRANPAGLTSRELQVLELLAQGLPNAEIGRRLFLVQKTVENHVSSILRKLDVSSRAQARIKAIQLGLVTQDR